MKRICALAASATILMWAIPDSVVPFPPAPHHLFYGLVRDEYGNPLNTDRAEVILETASGAVIKSNIRTDLSAGVNYQLAVPMDSGITSDLYKPTALRPMVPFKIKVKIGPTSYLPIEMAGDYSKMGQPGERTRLNLTLGEDADGDGLPDAWERALLAGFGGSKALSDIRSVEDLDGDGLSNLDEYIAGTYAFDAKDGFALKAVGFKGDAPVLEFMSVKGRTYTLYGSTHLKDWSLVRFRLPSDGPESDPRHDYQAADSRMLQVEVISENGGPAHQFYKLRVQ